MRILVTGAAGFIGSHAVDVRRAAGHEVVGLDSLTPAVHTGRPDYLPDDFDLAVGDVRDPDVVRRAVAGADVVCHQAALVGLDRKSTRLNSSHVRISYAVFCLKKKKKKNCAIISKNKGTYSEFGQ